MAKNKASTKEATPPTPKVVLRTYRDTDYDQVEYLYRSTQVPLVYESIRSKLWAPATWVIWFAVYSALLVAIPKVTQATIGTIPEWLMTGIKVFATFSWAVVGFATLFIASDRIELQNRIDEAVANDLSDPDLYYLNYTVQDDKKVRKPETEQVPSHFWVLTLDDELCGMIGLACHPTDLKDQRKELPVAWKQFVAAVLELFRLPVPKFFEKGKSIGSKVFAEKQEPKTARITRWAIRSDLQACGFSTLLINRALTWANEHDINRVYAETDECCMAAEQILTKRHGFVILKRFNLNFFGEYKKVFAVRVQEWMEKNGEKTRKVFNKK